MTRTRSQRFGALAVALIAALGCRHSGPSPRTLHYVGKDLVATDPVDHRAYAAYVQAQLALASEPPDLARAHEQIAEAIDHDPRDAHLWTVLGQIELQRGELDSARRASQRALTLRPDYPPARELAARVGDQQLVAKPGLTRP